MWALLTNKYVLAGIAVIALIAAAFWYRGVVYGEGFEAGQAEVKLAVAAAVEEERARQKKEADTLEQEARKEKERLEDELRKLREAKDPTKCYTTTIPPSVLDRLRGIYERYRN